MNEGENEMRRLLFFFVFRFPITFIGGTFGVAQEILVVSCRVWLTKIVAFKRMLLHSLQSASLQYFASLFIAIFLMPNIASDKYFKQINFSHNRLKYLEKFGEIFRSKSDSENKSGEG